MSFSQVFKLYIRIFYENTLLLVVGLSPFLGNSNAETYSNITSGNYTLDEDQFDVVRLVRKDKFHMIGTAKCISSHYKIDFMVALKEKTS